VTTAAVVGTGFGCITHIRALRAAGFEVTALVGRDPEKTATRAELLSVPRPATSLDAVLDEGDVVTVATPPESHAALVLAAVEAGKHVLCEKPFALDAYEARTMLEAAEAAGVVHLLGTEFRFAPGQALLGRVVRDGVIGAPRLGTFLLHIPLLASSDAQVPDWWGDATGGGGWLGAHGAHVVDQIRSTLGEIVRVDAALPHVVDRDWTAEDAYSVMVELADGAVAFIQGVASDRGPMVFMTRVTGTLGTVWVEGDVVRVADASGTREAALPPELAVATPEPPPAVLMHTEYDLLHATGIDLGPYTRLAEVFASLVRGADPASFDPAPATFADGVASMAVLDAMRESARERRSVELAR
jgi:predicted dehydrogenase